MLTWVSPSALNRDHVQRIAEALDVVPAFEKSNGIELIQRLYEGEAQAFEFPPSGLLLVEIRRGVDESRRLSILVFAGFHGAFKLKELAEDLRKLAAEWKCDKIETCTFDLRLAHAIRRVGGQIESVNLTLEVEG